MHSLWAPWRIEYIKTVDKDPGCFFCQALKSTDDAKHHVLLRGANCFALLNKYPYNNGHIMVAPNAHMGDLFPVSQEILGEMMNMVKDCQKIIAKVMNPHGFNVGINLGRVAGAGVLDHVHLHIVPRWDGDTNFMPVISDTKVIPQALDDVYKCLLKEKEELFKKN